MILGIKEGAKRFPHPHRCPFFLSLRHPGKKGRKKLKPKPTAPTHRPHKKKKTQHNTTQYNTRTKIQTTKKPKKDEKQNS
jgi:hypothetical protein